ncbi:MAG: mechanosensitive ion channel family protein [Gemmatimonadota bacterium]
MPGTPCLPTAARPVTRRWRLAATQLLLLQLPLLPLLLLLLAVASPVRLSAQIPGLGGGGGADSAPTVVSPLSPRVAVQEFQRLSRAGDYDGAARFLAVPVSQRDRAPLLARRLRTVLDQRLALEYSQISPLAVGDTADGSAASDRIGAIVGPDGQETPVLLTRARSGRPAWVFSTETVNAIDYWFENLGNPWLRDRLPPALMREGPLQLFYWQWIGIGLVVATIVLLTWLVSVAARTVVSRLAARTETSWDDLMIEHLRGPFRLWIAAIVAGPLFTLLDLNARLSAFVASATRAMVLFALFWAVLRAIRLVQQRMENVAWAAGHTQQARTLAPLVGNFLRVTVGIVAILVALAQFGYPVGTLLAGLGIGGIAVALAAQKTVEHLFGSVSLAADKAFRVGDWVRAGATEGAVERIGLRSTSFRTNDRTVVRVPNGRLADERIETFGERDRILLRTDLDLTYGTSIAQVEAIRTEIAALLAAHPKIWPDAVRVHVVAFTDSAIRINVMSWFLTGDYAEFLDIRHNTLLEMMRIIERHGSSFAFPSRTIYHVTPDGAPPQGGGASGAVAGAVIAGAATAAAAAPATAPATAPAPTGDAAGSAAGASAPAAGAR